MDAGKGALVAIRQSRRLDYRRTRGFGGLGWWRARLVEMCGRRGVERGVRTRGERRDRGRGFGRRSGLALARVR